MKTSKLSTALKFLGVLGLAGSTAGCIVTPGYLRETNKYIQDMKQDNANLAIRLAHAENSFSFVAARTFDEVKARYFTDEANVVFSELGHLYIADELEKNKNCEICGTYSQYGLASSEDMRDAIIISISNNCLNDMVDTMIHESLHMADQKGLIDHDEFITAYSKLDKKDIEILINDKRDCTNSISNKYNFNKWDERIAELGTKLSSYPFSYRKCPKQMRHVYRKVLKSCENLK